MARNTTLVKLLDSLRVEARLSLNPAHNAQNRDHQVRMLQREQERLWDDFDWPHLRVERQVATQAGQRYYETPDDIRIDRIERIEIFRDGGWCSMTPEIGSGQYNVFNSDLDERSWPPRNWRIHEDEDVEIWPIPDVNANSTTLEGYIKFVGIRELRPLVDDADRADLDDTMIVQYVAAQMLAASGAKDAKLKLDSANGRYSRLRGRLTPRRKFKMFGIGREPSSRKFTIGQYRPAES